MLCFVTNNSAQQGYRQLEDVLPINNKPIYNSFDADFSATPVQTKTSQDAQNMWMYLYYKFF